MKTNIKTEKTIEFLIYLKEGGDFEKAQSFSKEYGYLLTTSDEEVQKAKLFLLFDENGISLCDETQKMRGDFSTLLPRIKKENLFGEQLIKASFGKEKQVLSGIDATAGLGEDSFLLCAAGHHMTLIERDPVIFILLQDAYERALKDTRIAPIAKRMTLVLGDSIQILKDYQETSDFILLDPMFPERQKSGLIKKKFQLIHKLEKPCEEEEQLLVASRGTKAKKIIVKRPQKGPYLGNIKPNYSLLGNSIRYDIYI